MSFCRLLVLAIHLLVFGGPWRCWAGGPRIIFDTDMMTDCDDAGAQAVLHALADRGECEIVATVVSSRDRWSAAVVDGINRWYGRPSLPVGMVRGEGVLEPSKFTQKVGRECPGRFQNPEAEIPDALSIYRELLERAGEGELTIVTVGYLTNLRHLLDSPASAGHPSGRELIQRKVSRWICMGGNFVGTPAHDDLKLGNVNFQRDPQSALAVIRDWPGRVVFVGREIGSVPSGLHAGAVLAQTPEASPVRRAYDAYFGVPGKSRHVADLVTVLYAVRGLGEWWDLHEGGRMVLQADMTFDWRDDAPGPPQAYLLKKRPLDPANDRRVEAVLDELLLQPPAAK